MLSFEDKHFNSSDCLNIILARVDLCKLNSKEDLKWVSDLIRWLTRVRLVLMAIVEEVFKDHN